MIVAICPRAEFVARWRQAFPEGRVIAAVAGAALDGQPSQLWLHDGGIDERALADRVALLIRSQPGVPVVVFSAAPNQQRALRVLDAGARGFCHALAAPELMRQVATVVAHGGLWIGPELMKRMISGSSSIPAFA